MKKTSSRRRLWAAPCVALLIMLLGQTVANAIPLVGLTLDNKLVYFDSDAPGTIIRTVQITGLRQGEVLHGIDFREVGSFSSLGFTESAAADASTAFLRRPARL